MTKKEKQWFRNIHPVTLFLHVLSFCRDLPCSPKQLTSKKLGWTVDVLSWAIFVGFSKSILQNQKAQPDLGKSGDVIAMNVALEVLFWCFECWKGEISETLESLRILVQSFFWDHHVFVFCVKVLNKDSCTSKNRSQLSFVESLSNLREKFCLLTWTFSSWDTYETLEHSW